MDIKTWLLNKLARRIIPILQQVLKVVTLLEIKITETLDALTSVGITIDGAILNSIKTVQTALSIVRVAVERVLEYIGEPATVSQYVIKNSSLDTELERLKNLL